MAKFRSDPLEPSFDQVVENYRRAHEATHLPLYSPNTWQDPNTKICSTPNPEEYLYRVTENM